MIEQITVSIPQNLYQRVRTLARARNQPVDDVLIEFLEQALTASSDEQPVDEDTAVATEMNAFITMHPTLKKQYFGQHVAIFEGKLIDVDESYDTLYRRIQAQYPDQFVWMATIEEEAMPTLIFRSPRLEAIE